jgi:hypothetical protein
MKIIYAPFIAIIRNSKEVVYDQNLYLGLPIIGIEEG